MVSVSPPLPELLRVLSEGLTGQFWLRLSGREVGITVHSGSVMQVVGLPEMILLEGHRLTASVNTGNMLLDIGVAVVGGVPPDQAMNAASLGLGRFLARVSTSTECTAAWDDHQGLPSGSFPLPMPIIKALEKGLQEAQTPDMIQQYWRNQSGLVVRPSPAAAVAKATRGLSPVAARALSLASDGEVLSELVVRLVGGNPQRRTKTWWALDLLFKSGLLCFEEAPEAEEDEAGEEDELPRAEERSERRESRKASTRGDPAVTRMNRQYRKFLKMAPLDALEIKVVNPDLGLKADLVREAFRRSAKKYHPDRFTEDSVELRRAAAKCFQVLGDYRSQLEEPELLAAELHRLKAERLGRAHVNEEDKLKAKVLYNKGMSFFRNRGYVAARDAFAEAVILDADFRMATARHIHCRAILKEVPYQDAYMRLAEMEAETVGEKIELLFLTAWLLKLLGKEAEAIKQYQAILSRNPEHREALREVRLWEKRAGQRTAASRKSARGAKVQDSSSSGFFRSLRKLRDS